MMNRELESWIDNFFVNCPDGAAYKCSECGDLWGYNYNGKRGFAVRRRQNDAIDLILGIFTLKTQSIFISEASLDGFEFLCLEYEEENKLDSGSEIEKLVLRDFVLKRNECKKNPRAWYDAWANIVGNRLVEVKPYPVLAELLMLKKCLDNELVHKPEEWTGPGKHLHDIELENPAVSIEVKSTTERNKKYVTISSKDQLKQTNFGNAVKPLYLAFVAFEPASAETGLTMEKVIQEFPADWQPVLKESSKIKDGGLGWNDKAASIVSCSYYRVDEEFPKITSANFAGGIFPKGIEKIIYDVNLTGVAELNENDFFQELRNIKDGILPEPAEPENMESLPDTTVDATNVPVEPVPGADTETNNEIQQRLIQDNISLVEKIASESKLRGIPVSDLMKAGMIGLKRAAEKYQPGKINFESYATFWIRGEMRHVGSIPEWVLFLREYLENTFRGIHQLEIRENGILVAGEIGLAVKALDGEKYIFYPFRNNPYLYHLNSDNQLDGHFGKKCQSNYLLLNALDWEETGITLQQILQQNREFFEDIHLCFKMGEKNFINKGFREFYENTINPEAVQTGNGTLPCSLHGTDDDKVQQPKRGTLLDAAIEVILEHNRGMNAREIADAIIKEGKYQFSEKAKTPQNSVNTRLNTYIKTTPNPEVKNRRGVFFPADCELPE